MSLLELVEQNSENGELFLPYDTVCSTQQGQEHSAEAGWWAMRKRHLRSRQPISQAHTKRLAACRGRGGFFVAWGGIGISHSRG